MDPVNRVNEIYQAAYGGLHLSRARNYTRPSQSIVSYLNTRVHFSATQVENSPKRHDQGLMDGTDVIQTRELKQQLKRERIKT